ncbi:MAG: PAS domain S-box protein [Candidatus Limnocylindrales bacterium]
MSTQPDAGERLSRAVRSAGAGLWRFDESTGTVELSAQMGRLLGGADEGRAVSLGVIDSLLEPDARSRAEQTAERALASNGALSLDLQIRGLDGVTRWLQVSGRLERDPVTGRLRGDGIAIDITDRKRTEQRLVLGEAVSRIIARADELEGAIEEILAAVASGTQMTMCSLWLPSHRRGQLRARYIHVESKARGQLDGFVQATRESALALGQDLPGKVWEDRVPLDVADVRDRPGFERLHVGLSEGLTSGVAFPLTAGSAFIGVIELVGDPLLPSDERLAAELDSLGRALGQFIARTRAEERLRGSDIRQRLLVEILRAQRDAADTDAVMRVASETLGRHLEAARVGFVERRGQRLVSLGSWTADDAAAIDHAVTATVTVEPDLHKPESDEVVAVEDVSTDVRTAGTAFERIGKRGLISVPIMRFGGRVAGMHVLSHSPREWTRAEQSLSREVADHTWNAVERLRAEAAHGEADTLARTISDNSSQSLLLLEREGRVRYANPAAVEMFGFAEADIGSAPLHDLVHHHHPDGRPYARKDCPIDRAITARTDLRDHGDVFYRKDGSAFPVVCTVSPVSGPGNSGKTVLEIRDVTASRAAARQLAASERRFRATFENAAVGVAHVGLDGRWLRVNRRLCEITGYSESELRARTFQDITYPDDLDMDLEHVERLLRGEVADYSIEKRYLRGDGRPIWVDLTVALVRDEQDEPEYFIAVIDDIEDRKRAEARMQTALAVKEEFLGLVSHELRTPMTVIMGMSQILASGKVDLQQARAIADEIAESATELHELIESMLLLARFDKDEEAIREPAVLGRVAAATLERRRQRDATRRYELESGATIVVDAAPALLERVVNNLVTNAAKYSRPGEPVRVIVETSGPDAVLRVRDHGPGLEDDVIERVFEPFYRAPGSAQAPGAGLGLSVVRRIIESVGGRVWAKRHDDGSEFGFALPALDIEE